MIRGGGGGRYADRRRHSDRRNHALSRSRRHEKVVDLTGELGRGQTLRIHSGQVRPLHVLHQEDLAGAELHGFTGRDAYVWNNAEGDGPGLWRPSMKSWVDRTSYDPSPPEGAVLVRTGEKLIPAVRAASGW